MVADVSYGKQAIVSKYCLQIVGYKSHARKVLQVSNQTIGNDGEILYHRNFQNGALNSMLGIFLGT